MAVDRRAQQSGQASGGVLLTLFVHCRLPSQDKKNLDLNHNHSNIMYCDTMRDGKWVISHTRHEPVCFFVWWENRRVLDSKKSHPPPCLKGLRRLMVDYRLLTAKQSNQPLVTHTSIQIHTKVHVKNRTHGVLKATYWSSERMRVSVAICVPLPLPHGQITNLEAFLHDNHYMSWFLWY